MVEENINGRELECAVLGGQSSAIPSSGGMEVIRQAKASGIGEILAAAEFYDYDAKYNNEESRTVLSPSLPEGKAEEIQEAAERIFAAVDGYGLARVSFFRKKSTLARP